MPKIPKTLEACPQLVSGSITVLGQSVTIYAGTQSSEAGAPILFYWHDNGHLAAEVDLMMGTQIQEIIAEGGLVASFSTSLGTGIDTGGALAGGPLWFTDDYKMCDQILACAVQQLNIDVHRIYTAGCGAGGLQAGTMVYQRSSYLAAAMPNSGGVGQNPTPLAFDNPRHLPAVMTTHGAARIDVVGHVDFSQTSIGEDTDIVNHGGLAVDCNHGGGHCTAPLVDINAQWQFCKDHPYGASQPYKNGLPSGFPSYCGSR